MSTPAPADRSAIEGIAWPPMLTGETAVLAAIVAQFEQSQWFAPERIAAGQGAQLARLVAHHARQSPSFRARLKAAGLADVAFDDVAHLRELPPLKRADLQAAGRHFVARHVPKGHLPVGETRTSGSTGEPVTVRRTAVNRLMWAACTLREHRWQGRSTDGRMASVRPTNPKATVEQDDWGHPVADLHWTGKALSMPSTVDIDEQLAQIDRFQPDSLLAFPTNLRALAERWATRPAGMPKGLRHVRTVGETVSPALRELMRTRFRREIEDNYSSQEIGVIALQCPGGSGYHAMAEAIVVEVLGEGDRPCAPGEVGRLVVTDLHNFASPMVRYEIGDWAEVGAPCACGRGLPTLERILGRERNLLRKPDGSRHWPLVGFHRFDAVAPVRQYQVVQHRLDDVELKVVTDQSLSDEQIESLAAIVGKALGLPGTVRVSASREPLPTGRGGKFEEFICHVRDEVVAKARA